MNQCWAYNQTATRCTLEAGHDGLHMVASTWSDDECFNPTASRATKPAPTPVTVPEPTEQQEAKSCVACGHKHKGGACKCGCHTHIG